MFASFLNRADVTNLREEGIGIPRRPIEKLSRLYIRDRHLYACDEQGILSHQEKVRHPPACKDIQKKDAIDDKDNGKLLFVVDS